MGGYNTVCEIASARRRAVIVPRAKPVLEQSIRAERFAARGLVSAVDPDRLSSATLAAAVLAELQRAGSSGQVFERHLDMSALPKIATFVSMLLDDSSRATRRGRLLPFARRIMAPLPSLHFAHAGGVQ
jgi:predicted glycosyltransferase